MESIRYYAAYFEVLETLHYRVQAKKDLSMWRVVLKVPVEEKPLGILKGDPNQAGNLHYGPFWGRVF